MTTPCWNTPQVGVRAGRAVARTHRPPERFQRRNTVSTDVGDVDVFTIVSDEGGGYV
ncbi:MAG: hypothetical protein IPG74_03530 [Flavobacteriales bacterium]|nr:hypothetical protein [Flavobacteriales bacterium]